ncbi:MAG: hypothetical protein RLZZ383_1490 [Pseudomonadota bacterium]|jgi:hypothetical protein
MSRLQGLAGPLARTATGVMLAHAVLNLWIVSACAAWTDAPWVVAWLLTRIALHTGGAVGLVRGRPVWAGAGLWLDLLGQAASVATDPSSLAPVRVVVCLAGTWGARSLSAAPGTRPPTP